MSVTPVPVDVAELRRLLENAAERPWQWLDSGGEYDQYDELQDGRGEQIATGFRDDLNLDHPGTPGRMTDGRLCAAAVNALPDLLDTLDSLTAERRALEERAAKAERLNAMLPDELTRLADLLEAKVPVPSNRTYYEEGWLDAVRAVTDELRSLRAALSEGGSK